MVLLGSMKILKNRSVGVGVGVGWGDTRQDTKKK